ncbi:hypothetical protein PVAG01_08563 [Phlyctema vagabunda]|uniref:Glycosyltransferase family 8 protein n=1 Tax=Phlyctema vagabunda TaxID=108571 RepID=A0ABR4P9S0_9HELO
MGNLQPRIVKLLVFLCVTATILFCARTFTHLSVGDLLVPTPSISELHLKVYDVFGQQEKSADQEVSREDLKSSDSGESEQRQHELPDSYNKDQTKQVEIPRPRPSDNFAFALFLAAPGGEGKETDNDYDDLYFVATRMLLYQLLHDPSTRTNNSYPVVILVTQDVVKRKIERLRGDGADVRVVQKLYLDWAPTRKAWQDVLTKLHLFDLTEYEKVLFLDSDTLLTRRMDDIFFDPATEVINNKGDTSEGATPLDEPAQPKTYMFAGNAGAGGFNHSEIYPPPKGNNLNAGCMVIRPAKDLYKYYLDIAKIKDRFNGRYPEQSLWWYVHRREGNMPWIQLNHDWNINRATWADYEHKIASLHAKWWSEDNEPKLRDFAMQIRGKMQGFWEGKEGREIYGA